ncbi:MAG: NirA family protein [Paracoccaceae bacterium]
MDGAPGEPFTTEQKEYIAGYAAGIAARNLFAGHDLAGRVTNDPGAAGANLAEPAEETFYGFPVNELSREEQLKREKDPRDLWEQLISHARENKPPEDGDVFRFKAQGLFWVAPNQESFMCRLRTPGGVLTTAQARGIGAIAREHGAGHADLTTRSNIQVREIAPHSIVEVLTALDEIGLGARGAGCDNIRNITAPPTSGFDPQELLDVRPYCRALQQYIYNTRDMYGLPRKINIAFDSGGAVSVLSDTNDIGFVATTVAEGHGVEPGLYFRVLLCGITGHERLAFDCGLLVRPDEAVALSAAIVRAFVETGDRTDRKKARLCYVLDRLGTDGFLAKVQEHLAFPLRHLAADKCAPRPPEVRGAHLGVRPQRQPGLNSIGVDVPVGRMSCDQIDGLAAIADDFGAGELRLTVWQNLMIPGVPDARLADALAALRAIGLRHDPSPIAGGLVACTGNRGCRFANADTKGHALALGRHLDATVALDEALNIHFTGCPNSCAQHYVGDIGLLGTTITRGGESVEGYHVYVGGGCGEDGGIARELARSVPFDELNPMIERLLLAYGERRAAKDSFVAFARRHDIDDLRTMAGIEA